MKTLSPFILSALLAHVALLPTAAQENARATASVSYSNGVAEQGARWTWGREGLNIVSDTRGVLLMDGHYEDTVLVAEVDYSTTDDVDFRTCRFGRLAA